MSQCPVPLSHPHPSSPQEFPPMASQRGHWTTGVQMSYPSLQPPAGERCVTWLVSSDHTLHKAALPEHPDVWSAKHPSAWRHPWALETLCHGSGVISITAVPVMAGDKGRRLSCANAADPADVPPHFSPLSLSLCQCLHTHTHHHLLSMILMDKDSHKVKTVCHSFVFSLVPTSSLNRNGLCSIKRG